MKFAKEFLLESLDDSEATVYDKVTGTTRWSVLHERVFRHEGEFYQTHYSVGATEYQDESPYEHDDAEVECHEMVAVEKTVTVYVRASDTSTPVISEKS